MKILLDMNLSPRWVNYLQNAGYQAITWSSVGPANARDSDIMAYAIAHEYVIVTHDLDFSAMLLTTRSEAPSVLQIRSDDLDPDTIGATVLGALNEIRSRAGEHLLATVDPKRTRVRVLPFSHPA